VKQQPRRKRRAGRQEPKELDKQERLVVALDAINCWVSDSLSATLFPLKWQLVKDRLNRLHAGLGDITLNVADDDTDARCDAFTNLLRRVAATAHAGAGDGPEQPGPELRWCEAPPAQRPGRAVLRAPPPRPPPRQRRGRGRDRVERGTSRGG
jgi:hypothetical protein